MLPQNSLPLELITANCAYHLVCVFRLEDFDGEEVDEEAVIEQRRQQRLAIVQVCLHLR